MSVHKSEISHGTIFLLDEVQGQDLTEAYSESCQTSKMERFAKVVNRDFHLSTFLHNKNISRLKVNEIVLRKSSVPLIWYILTH